MITTLIIFTVIFYGLALIWQDDIQREKIKNELDRKYGNNTNSL